MKIENFAEITRAIVTYDLLTPARFQSLLLFQSANLSLIIPCRKNTIGNAINRPYRETLAVQTVSSIKTLLPI